MSKKNEDGLNYIIQAINNIVDAKIDNLKYDRTYRGKITAVVNSTTYKVQINGAEYQLPYEGTLKVGDIVKVKAPLNNFSDIYVETKVGGVIDDTYEEIDISSYKTNKVSNITRAKMIKYGKLIFVDIVCTISNNGELFSNLPYKPIFNTELNCANNYSSTSRVLMNTDCALSIGYLSSGSIYISGVYFIE